MSTDITPDSLLEVLAHSPPVFNAAMHVSDRYELRGTLGEGGFGVVYDAFDRSRGHYVALKTLRCSSASLLMRLKREFRSLVDLEHPNLIRLHDLVGTSDGIYFTMERVESAVRFDEWAARGEQELRMALAQVISGLAALHERGLVHRDIKPSNVLVDGNGRVVIVDFGLVYHLERAEATHSAGTPIYMAPEQYNGGPLSSAVDAYSLGVMLFECLAGSSPFQGNSPMIGAAKQREAASALESVRPDAPADLARLVNRLLARDPQQRPSMGSLSVERAEPVVPPTFVGRHEPLLQLGAAVEASSARLVEIVGVSGIGKTALVNRFVSGVGRSAVVLRGRCHPREEIAYKAFDEVMDQLATVVASRPELAGVLPRDVGALCALFPAMRVVLPSALSPALNPPSRERGLAACRELFSRLAERTPVVLTIDDIQWGDEDSAGLLAELLRGPNAPGIVVVATRRTDEVGELMARFERLDISNQIHHETILLEGLGEGEARRLAELLVPDAVRAAQVAIQAAGHPLLLRELALHRHGGTGTLLELVGLRLESLSAEGLRALRLMSVAGYPLERKALEGLAAEAADELLERGLIQLGPAGLSLFHDCVADAVSVDLCADTRRELHRVLGEALIALAEHDVDSLARNSERIANHLTHANDSRASGYLLRAARYASTQLGFVRAAALFGELLGSAPAHGGLPVARGQLERERGDALAGAGEAKSASEAYLAAARLALGDEAARLRCLAAQQLTYSGNVDEAWTLFDKTFVGWGVGLRREKPAAVLQIAGNLISGSVRRRFRPGHATARRRTRLDAMWSAFGALAPVRPFSSLSVAAQYIAEAQAVDDPLHRFRADGMLAYGAALRAGPAGWGEQRARLRRAYAPVSSDPRAELTYLAIRVMIDCFGMRTVQAGRTARACLDLADDLGAQSSFEALSSQALLASAHQYLGDIVDRERFVDRLLGGEAANSAHPMQRHLGHVQAWSIALWRHGDSPQAREHKRIAWQLCAKEHDFQRSWHRFNDVFAALARDEPDVAHQVMRRGAPNALVSRAINIRLVALSECLLAGLVAVATAARSGSARALAAAEHSRRVLSRVPAAHGLTMSLTLAAGIASINRDDVETRRALHALCHVAEESGCVLLLALARHELGTMDGDSGLTRQAGAFFEASGIADPVYAARLTLPGAFRITGLR